MMNPDDDGNTPPTHTDTSLESFLVNTGITLTASFASWFLFEILRVRKSLSSIYCPRLFRREGTCNILQFTPTRIFSWIRVTWQLKEQQILQHCGYDALMYLRFLRLCFYLFLLSLIIPLILIPIHTHGGQHISGFSSLSMANVESGSPILWVHFFLSISLLLVLYAFLFVTYAEYTRQRQLYLKSTEGIHHRTLYVTGLPSSVKTNDILAQNFQKLKMGDVTNAALNPEYDELARIVGGDKLVFKVQQRGELLVELESRIVEMTKKVLLEGKRHSLNHPFSIHHSSEILLNNSRKDFWEMFLPLRRKLIDLNLNSETHHSSSLVSFSLVVHSGEARMVATKESIRQFQNCNKDIERMKEKLIQLDKEIEDLRRNHLFEPSNSGFVTFRQTQSAHILSQVLIHPAPFAYHSKMAPEPRDILWENISLRRKNRKIRQYLVEASVIAVTFFCVAPVGLIASVASIVSLLKLFPSLISWVNNVHMYYFFQTILPNLLIIGFMQLVPYVFLYLTKLQGEIAWSNIEKVVMTRLFFFTMFNVLFAFTIISTILKTYASLSDPGAFLSKLAEKITQSATIHINYVILTIAGRFIELLQITSLVTTFLISRQGGYFSSNIDTHRKLFLSVRPPPPPYSTIYPIHMIVFVISLTYSAIHPIILPFAFLYFGFSNIMDRYQFTYVYQPTYETGGQMWPLVFDRIIVAIEVWLGTLSGYFFLKNGSLQGLGIMFFFIVTLFFRLFCVRLFSRRGTYLAMWGLQDESELEEEGSPGQPFNAAILESPLSIDSITELANLYRTSGKFSSFWYILLKPAVFLLCESQSAELARGSGEFHESTSLLRPSNLQEHFDSLERNSPTPYESIETLIPTEDFQFIPKEYVPPASNQPLTNMLWLPEDPLSPVVLTKPTGASMDLLLSSDHCIVSTDDMTSIDHDQFTNVRTVEELIYEMYVAMVHI